MTICRTCDGQACEENCGLGGSSPVGCLMAHAGPDSHKVCRTCEGRGRVVGQRLVPQVGSLLYGYCGGHFGRDSYGTKRIEAMGADWTVVRMVEGGAIAFTDCSAWDLIEYMEDKDA